MKLATSFAALAHFGPDYRFQTRSMGTPNWIQRERASWASCTYTVTATLFRQEGSGCAVSIAGTARVASSRRRLGGDRAALPGRSVYNASVCRATSPCAYPQRHCNRRKNRSASWRIREPRLQGALLKHTSTRLRDILWEQNAHSVNEIADRLGYLLGGSSTVQQFLVETVALKQMRSMSTAHRALSTTG